MCTNDAKKGRCEDKIRVSLNTKKEMEKKENRKIH